MVLGRAVGGIVVGTGVDPTAVGAKVPPHTIKEDMDTSPSDAHVIVSPAWIALPVGPTSPE
jgi:hypothetical protein